VTANVETALPWQSKAWRRRMAAVKGTLAALYAVDRRTVLEYARRSGATHILVNRARYRGDPARRSRVFEPVDSWLGELLEGRRAEEMVLSDPPASAVVFRDGPWRLVDVDRLKKAWESSF
jgi:hypothetical protein